MLRYFEENECWTREALDLTSRVAKYLEGIIEEQRKKGYSVRETAHILQGAVFEAEIKAAMDAKKRS